MSTYQWLLFLHILGAFLFLSGSVFVGIAHFAAMRRERPSEVAILLGVGRLAVPLVGVGSLATLVLGILLADEAGYGIGDEWVVASIVLWAVSAVAAAPAGRTLRHARVLATRLAAEDDAPSVALRTLVRSRTALALNYASFAIVVAILVLMIFKPGAG